MNSTRPLTRTPAYWLMVALSGVSALLGAWLIVDKLPAMEAGLEDQTATTALVYGGQSWVVVGAALLGAGMIGLVLSLGVAALRAASRPAAIADDATVLDEPADETVVGEAEPVEQPDAEGEPVAPEAEPVRG